MRIYIFFILISFVSAKHEDVEGWKSYFVKPSNIEQLSALNKIVKEFNLDFYSHAGVNREGLVFVSPKAEDVGKEFDNAGISYRIHAEDLKAHFEKEGEIYKSQKVQKNNGFGGKLPYDQYQTVDTIYQYLEDIAAEHPNVAKVVTPKNSFNGLPIKYLKVSTTNFEDQSKPIIFLDGGIHGREWLSIPPVTYAVHKLVENVTENDLLEKFDWILLPVVNPDGYMYSRVISAAWRKTRSYNEDPFSRMCPGVDIDRNFDIRWNTVGTSEIHCSYVYPGTHAFSEVETTVVRDILEENGRIAMYISFSSFGSLILYPWAYEATLSSNAFGLHAVGVSIAEAINKNKLPSFMDYVVGNAAMVRQVPMSGTSVDYAHYLGVPFAYSIELPGLFGGFFMNPIYIEQVCFETWEGIVSGARRAAELLVN